MNAVHRVLTYASNISYYNISMCTGSIAEDLEIPSTIAKAIMNILHALNNQFQAEAASNVLESILLNFWNIEPFFLNNDAKSQYMWPRVSFVL